MSWFLFDCLDFQTLRIFRLPEERLSTTMIFYSFCFNIRYLNAIQTTCPHILRYLTTAVITNKRRKSILKDLVRVIQQESYTYRDPITEFLECLYVNFDFDGAQKKLVECETVSCLIDRKTGLHFSCKKSEIFSYSFVCRMMKNFQLSSPFQR